MKCSFCSNSLKSGTGKMYVENNGTIYYWCSRKCERSQRMGRNRKKLKWARK